MREIKFRAWTFPNKKELKEVDLEWMFYFEKPDFGDGSMLSFSEKQELSFNGYNRKNVLMQFTGLRDKNGKEIYEGDIVENICPNCEEHNGMFKWPIKDMMDMEPMDCGCGGYFDYSEHAKIIGNIYENPELLK